MTPKVIVLQPQISVTVVGYEEVGDVRYNNSQKYAKCTINLLLDDGQKQSYPEITLWEGAAYDAIGQWQDSDVTSRIEAILAAL